VAELTITPAPPDDPARAVVPVAYNQRDAAAAMGVCPRTLRAWEAKGLLRATTIGGVKRYAAAELQRLADPDGGTSK
jgi:hypothetical protein